MSCCCTNVFDICGITGACVGDTVNTTAKADEPGIYKLKLSFLNSEVSIDSAELEAGDDIVFPTEKLNENFEYTGKILKPSGELKTFVSEDAVEYDCISFTTGSKISL